MIKELRRLNEKSEKLKGLKKELENIRGFPGGSDTKEFACNAGDPGSIPGSGRSLG